MTTPEQIAKTKKPEAVQAIINYREATLAMVSVPTEKHAEAVKTYQAALLDLIKHLPDKENTCRCVTWFRQTEHDGSTFIGTCTHSEKENYRRKLEKLCEVYGWNPEELKPVHHHLNSVPLLWS